MNKNSKLFNDSCMHVWRWKEPSRVKNRVPKELEVWCEMCGERHDLMLVFGPMTPPEEKLKRWKRFCKELDRLVEIEQKEWREFEQRMKEISGKIQG